MESSLERKLKRVTAAKIAAEKLLEQKSLELYNANKKLELALHHVEQRSAVNQIKFEIQQNIEKQLLYFSRIFMRSQLDDVLLNELINHLNDISDKFSCVLVLNCKVLPTLTQKRYGTESHSQHDFSPLPIIVEQKEIGQLRLLVHDSEIDMGFVSSQISLICELLSNSILRQRVNLKLVQSKERAEASERSTRDFLAMINHELRTPLNGLLGSVELLADTSLSPTQKDLHDNLIQSGQLLRAIINDLLDFSKINANMLELIPSEFQWQTLETMLKSIFLPKAKEKGIELLIKADGLDNIWFKGDQERITQIFVNLMGNAIKFTNHGQVQVIVNFDKQSSRFHFSITDTGIGISQQAQQNLFQPFTQADISTTRNYEGTGLGLAICKKLIELMSGSITLSSILGKGTTFKVELPLPILESAESLNKSQVSNQQATSFEHLRILVVDDIKMNLMIITKMLEKLNITPIQACNGAEAIEMINQHDFDLVLMDCRMPILDGYQATIKLIEQGYTTPIIALTAGTTKEERQKCLDSGMVDILSKPYTKTDLVHMMDKWAVRNQTS
ncbi:ATP-binding protein [Paraferrimonas sp. SM1919]|uniref:ATP-binding protein n=1 Tax=Paraferrimonas sp. SM1919 TaxID=2662263 RepID=UPI0013D6118F|nr:ATP-binding protein [Paraferrimonas sp. SM1919]